MEDLQQEIVSLDMSASIIRIHIDTPNKSHPGYILDVSPWISVKDIKAQLHLQTGVNHPGKRLFYENNELSDGDLLCK